ncbi:MFS transporter [Cohnella suwonensis]|uniref:MFS transporter n=1 Tax=Cohnella suwonensis TaxID=696072 RepID=A0ABW0LVJ7_9BACL
MKGRYRWLAGLNFFVSGTMAFIAIYFPLILERKSFTLSEIGFALAIGSLVGFFGQFFWGMTSDRRGSIRFVLFALTAGTCLLAFGLRLSDSYLLALTFAVAIRFCSTSLLPLTDLWTLRHSENGSGNFGAFRLWGSVGYVASALAFGWAASLFDLNATFWALWLTAALYALAVFLLPETGRPADSKAPKISEALSLFRAPATWLFLGVTLLINVPARAFDGFFSLYVKSMGGDDGMIAAAAIVAPLFEIPFFLYGTKWIGRIGHRSMLLYSALLYMAIWLFYMWNDSVILLALSQVAMSGAYVMFYLAALSHMRAFVPERLRATGQMLLFMFMNTLSAFAGNALAGYMLENGHRTWLFGFSLAFACGALILVRLLPKAAVNNRSSIAD